MSERFHGPFEALDPPPGGVERLRERIARSGRARARRRRVVRGLAALPVLAVLAWAMRPEADAPAPAFFEFSPTRIGLGIDAPPDEPVTVPPADRGSVAISRVSLGTDAVLLYLVGSVE
jgi:hypothetical protein